MLLLVAGPLTLTWANWFTLLGFLILIKPLRERSTFFMLQFNSLDRPEDRPNTLSWIVGGNILPGCAMIIFFKCVSSTHTQHAATPEHTTACEIRNKHSIFAAMSAAISITGEHARATETELQKLTGLLVLFVCFFFFFCLQGCTR